MSLTLDQFCDYIAPHLQETVDTYRMGVAVRNDKRLGAWLKACGWKLLEEAQIERSIYMSRWAQAAIRAALQAPDDCEPSQLVALIRSLEPRRNRQLAQHQAKVRAVEKRGKQLLHQLRIGTAPTLQDQLQQQLKAGQQLRQDLPSIVSAKDIELLEAAQAKVEATPRTSMFAKRPDR